MTVRTLCVALALLVLSVDAAQANPEPQIVVPEAGTSETATTQRSTDPKKRDEQLGLGWQQSTDRAWTTSGDPDGFHILVADAATGYTWRTAATLSEPGFDADQWVGNACVSESGKRAAVVYAPRTFTNKAELFDRGGFTATVDLDTGAVVKLPIRSTLAYFNPGCGTGESAVLTQSRSEDVATTRLTRLDTSTAMLGQQVELPGQVTSAVPTASGIVVANGATLVKIAATGEQTRIAESAGIPFHLRPDAEGGVVFMERSGDKVRVRRSVPADPQAGVATLATGALNELGLTAGKAGSVFLTGKAETVSTLPGSVMRLDLPRDAELSTEGKTAILKTERTGRSDPRTGVEPRKLELKVVGTDNKIEFVVDPAAEIGTNAASGRVLHPKLVGPGVESQLSTTALDNPLDAERTCSVPRGDPNSQVTQPTPQQAEWAADRAVLGTLENTDGAQKMFPSIPLIGGQKVPPQVLLGIMAQESNLWQAARFALPGVTGNPLIGNYYGLAIYSGDESDDWDIRWGEADCGYGITQVTDGMRIAGREGTAGGPALPADQQRAIALDHKTNIARGLQLLQMKWNETRTAGLIVNDGNPRKIENWFFAAWAYNSGFNPDKRDGSAWGLGWLNNPVNPRYPANRLPFMEFNQADAKNPQWWPYPEKVMGWAAQSIATTSGPGFAPAWWNAAGENGNLNRENVKPPVDKFCTAANQCVPGQAWPPDDPSVLPKPGEDPEKPGPCDHRNPATGLRDLKCWWHSASTWKPDCDQTCGNWNFTYDDADGPPTWGVNYPPKCDRGGLPASAMIVDDLAQTPPPLPGKWAASGRRCARDWVPSGRFSLAFKSPSAKIDFHQIGAGFDNHFWFAHTRSPGDSGGKFDVMGTWKLNQSYRGPMSVLVALPDHGAHTNHATYVVKTARGDRTRVVRQPGEGNRWASIGSFMFDGVPEVTLSSVAPDGNSTEDIAFDAIAFVPISGTYHEESVEAVTVLDEDTNIDTTAPNSWIAGPLANRQKLFDWANHHTNQVREMPLCFPDKLSEGCAPAETKRVMSVWRDQVHTAGTDPVNHPDGASIARWIGFAQPYTDRPSTDQRPDSFNDDDRYKTRNKATVSFITGPNGKIIEGSEWAAYQSRTGNTHMPQFVVDLMRAMKKDYGIDEPDLRYQMQDLNAHNGGWTSVDPMRTGTLPGRAYAFAGKAPVAVDASGAPSQDNAVCIAALTNGGGSIGYRPMLSQSGPVNAMEAWVARLDNDARVPQKVADLAEDIREMFFDNGMLPGAESSLFTQAAPIWQELNFKACADGTIQKISSRPLLRASHMSDQYIYHNDRAMDLDGRSSGSNQPVMKGDFQKFSAFPDPNQAFPAWPNAFGLCGAATGRSGNPWNISPLPVPQDPGINPPRARFCLDTNLSSDPSHSS